MSAVQSSEQVEAGSVEVSRPAEGAARLRIRSEPLGVLRQAVKAAMLAALETVESDDQGLNFALERSRLPVIAACNGLTLGGGNELAIACDLRIAARSARFGFPEVKVAAFASAGGTQRLPQLVGPGRAMDLLLTGRIIESDEALAIGLVDFVVDDDDLEARSVALAAEIAALPAGAIAITKRCVTTGLRDGRVAGHQLESELTVELGLTEDAAEGQAAFLEKRAPQFNRSSGGGA